MPERFDAAIDALEKALRQSVPMRRWLRARRWCGDTIAGRTELAVKDRAVLASDDDAAVVFFLAVAREPNASIPIHVPLAISTAKADPEAFELSVGSERLYVEEGERSRLYARFLVDGFRDRLAIRTLHGDVLHFQGEPLGALRSTDAGPEDSSNVLVRITTDRGGVVFKSYKLLDLNNREPAILERLEKKGFRRIPRYRGELALGKGTDRVVLGVASERIEAPDAFAWLTDGWRGELAGASPPDFERASLALAADLGEATADLHDALTDGHPGPFQGEAFTREDAQAATRAALANLSDSLRRLVDLAKGPDAPPAKLAADARMLVFENRERIEAALGGLAATVGTAKGVSHADLHLAQVLRTPPGDLYFLDFEGEPEREPAERSMKLPFLRDVATMNRSFAYVKHYAWREAIRGDATAAWRFLAREEWSAEQEVIALRLQAWESAAAERFSRRYLERSGLYREVEPEDALRAVRGWAVEKALYELRYELKHRPQNIFIPLEGAISLSAEISESESS